MDLQYHFSFLFSERTHTVLSCLLGMVALIMAFRARERAPAPDWRWIWMIGALLTIGRWPSIWYPHQLNPDESQLLAGVHTLRFDPVFWRSVNGMTSGPLNFYALWPMGWLLGADSYLSARLTALALLGIAFSAVHLTVSRRYGAGVARLSALPTLCLVSFSAHADFNHYSTELLSMALISVAICLAARLVFDGAREAWREVVVGFLLGCVPLAKPQAIPIAFVLGVALAAWLWWSPRSPRPDRAMRVARLVGSSLVPLGLAGAMVGWNHLGSYVWVTFWLNNRAYVESAQMSVFHAALRLVVRTDPPSPVLWVWVASGVAFFALALPWLKTRNREERIFLGASLLLLVVAAIAVVTPRRPFPHYLMLLPVPWMLVCGGFTHRLMKRTGGGRGPMIGALAALGGMVVLLTAVRAGMPYPLEARFSPFSSDFSGRVTLEVRKYARPEDALTVWGWRCEYYVLAGLRQGARDALTEGLMLPGPYRAFFRELYLSDVTNSRPVVFVDGVGPGAFYYDQRSKQGHEAVFPELAAWVGKNYRLANDIDGARIYVREDRYREVAQRETPSTGARLLGRK